MSVLLPETPAVDALLSGARLEVFRVDLLTRVDGVIGPIDGVDTCSVAVDADALIGGGGQLVLHDRGQELAWASQRVQPWVRVNEVEWPLGVFLLSAPVTQYSATGRSWNVQLSDKLTVLDADQIAESISLAAGAVVTDAILAVIAASGETSVAITPSDATLQPPGLTWPIGTSRLTVINGLLGAINYNKLRADAYGTLHAGPATDPATRPVTREFIEGETAIHEATFEVQRDLATVPNRIICTWQADPSTPMQRAIAEDLDPASPTSYPNRGRWVTTTYENQEADSQATLDAIAAKYLREALAPQDTVVFSHARVPMELGDVVRFRSADVDILGEVRRMENAIGVGQLATTTIRKVRDAA